MNEDAVMKRDHERQEVIRNAVQAADQVLVDAADGDQSQLEQLTVGLALYILWNVPMGRVCMQADFRNFLIIRTAFVEIIRVIAEYETISEEVIATATKCQIAKEFVEKAINPSVTALMRWDLEHPAT